MSLVDEVRAWIQRSQATGELGPIHPRDAEALNPPRYGRCRCCKDLFRLDRGGDVRTHGLMGGRLCLGSNQPPEVDR